MQFLWGSTKKDYHPAEDIADRAITSQRIFQHDGRPSIKFVPIAIRLEPVAGSCEDVKKLAGSLQRWEFLALQRTLLRKDSPPVINSLVNFTVLRKLS